MKKWWTSKSDLSRQIRALEQRITIQEAEIKKLCEALITAQERLITHSKIILGQVDRMDAFNKALSSTIDAVKSILDNIGKPIPPPLKSSGVSEVS